MATAMKRRSIDLADCAGEIVKALKKGVLLTTRAGDKANSMVIGWGTLGTNWAKPVFAAYVRESRYTRALLDRNPEFTVNVPLGDYDPKIWEICGSKSGRDMDKLQAAGLTPVPGEKVSVPALKEFPLTLECRVIYRQAQDPALLEGGDRFYPPDASGRRDSHVTYYGEVVAAYVLEEA